MADAAASDTKASPSNPFAALGAGAGAGGAAFGSGGFTFGDLSASSAPKPQPAEEEGAEGDENEGAAEEECQAEFKPIVQLEEVETATGEEDEEVLLELKSKLYRFDSDAGEWKERGMGQTRLLQHKANKKIRLLMRQDKTLKIRANHIVMPGVKLQEHAGTDKAWVWSIVDFSDETQKVELFCMRFGSVEKAAEFKKKFEEAQDVNAALIGPVASAGGERAEEEEEADALADEVEAKAVVA